MPIPKNYVPFATSAISSDTRGVNSDRSDKLYEIKQDASNNRDLVAKKMPPSQIEKAQDLARECVKKNYKGC